MSEQGAEFLIAWAERNIDPAEFPPDGDKAVAEQKARQCLAEAEAAGLTQRDLESEVGPLAAFMNVRMSTPADPELRWTEAPPPDGTVH